MKVATSWARDERSGASRLFSTGALVGPPASRRADPEDVRARIRPYHARLRAGDRALRGHGREVRRRRRHGRLRCSGRARGRRRARRAGRASDPGGDRGAERAAILSSSLQVRVGINTGEAVVALGARPEAGRGDRDRRRRQHRLAAPGRGAGRTGSRSRSRRTGRPGACSSTSRSSRWPVKGKAEPLALFRPLAPRPASASDVTRTYATPLVGRELEKPLLDRVRSSGRSQQRSLPAGHDRRRAGRRARAASVAELFAYLDDRTGSHPLAPGALPSVRRRDHVLGARRDRQGGVRDPRVRLGGGRGGEARAGASPETTRTRLAASAAGAAGRASGGEPADRSRRRSPPGGASSRRCAERRADRARVRGPALGGRGAARVPRAPRRVVGGRAAARCCAPRGRSCTSTAPAAARARETPTRSTSPLCRSGDGRARLGLLERAVLRARRSRRSSSAQAATRSTPRSSCACSRTAACTPAAAEECAGERAGADRRPPRHARPRAQEPASGRGRAREGVLGRRARRDGRPRAGSSSSWRCTSSRARSSSARLARARWKARASTPSGTCSCATSPTPRSRGRSRRPPPGGRRLDRAQGRRAGRRPGGRARPPLPAGARARRAAGRRADAASFASPALRYLALAGRAGAWARRRARRERGSPARSSSPGRRPSSAPELLERWAHAAQQQGRLREAKGARGGSRLSPRAG